MNKLLIPAILTATIFVGAAFAFIPVQKVTTTHLPSVGTTSIADGSVTSAKIADGTIAAVDIGAGVITSAEIAADTVASADIALDTIAAVDIAPDAVAASELASIAAYNIRQVADGTAGWVPDGIATSFTVTDNAAAITTDSVFLITIDGSGATACSVRDITAATNFIITCSAAVTDGSTLNYLHIDP